jgi:predicted PurR-regulated permease PerM
MLGIQGFQKNWMIAMASFSLVVILIFVSVTLFITSKQVTESALENAQPKALEREQVLQNFLKRYTDHLHFISRQSETETYLQEKSESAQKALSKLFHNVASLDYEIMQLRLIDQNGQEMLRVDRKHSASRQVESSAELQNKADRYAFI